MPRGYYYNVTFTNSAIKTALEKYKKKNKKRSISAAAQDIVIKFLNIREENN